MPEPIPMQGRTTVKLLAAQEFFLRRDAHDRFVNQMLPPLWEHAAAFNIPAELVAVVAYHETGGGHYQGTVGPERRNMGGLKKKSGGGDYDPDAHEQFNDWDEGARALLQYLRAYADTIVGEPIAPRVTIIQQGSAPTLEEISGPGKYNENPDYGPEREDELRALREFARSRNGEEEPLAAQIPGFKRHDALSSHYREGRTHTIIGYAQHYTAGSNSLGWLSGDSSPPVSATFLIRHNPTLEDRGWQLVAIEDSAWTTAEANPMTVSCEYEHSGGPVPDEAYTVMAQTIIDTAEYVARHGLGTIPLNREGIKGHREWVGPGRTVCPDGINMDRLVTEVQRRAKGDDPVSKEIELNGFRIVGGFKDRYEALGPMALSVFGLPQSDEFTAEVDGVERTVQIYERCVMSWYPDDQPHGVPPDDAMHVRCLTLPEAIAVRQWAADAGIL